MAQYTGYSAPPSERTDGTPLNSETSSGSVKPPLAATKKYKPTTAFDALVAATPAVPALVATLTNVERHNAAQMTTISSSSDYSVASSAERHRRLLCARAQRKLADARAYAVEARMKEVQAEIDLSASSHAGSVGRLNDVRSEGGNSARARRRDDTAAPLIQLDEVANEPPPTNRRDHTNTDVRAPARETPSDRLGGRALAREAPPKQIGVCALAREAPPELVGERALAREASANELGLGVRALAREAPPTELGCASASWTPSRPPITETPTSSSTYVLSQNILNDGCDFGAAVANAWQEAGIAVEHVVHIAEERHSQAMASMAETTNLDHQQQMANVIRDAHDALQRQAHEARVLLQTQAQNHASDTQRI